MSGFRKVIFWLHLCCGVAGGIVIFIMCITGAALAFEKNIIEFFERDQRYVNVGATRLAVHDVLQKVVDAEPKARPTSLVASNDPSAAVTVALGRDGQAFVNPYSGEITGRGHAGVRGFFRFSTDLHRYIALSGDGRAVGKAITGACNLMFLILAITGIYIWMPRRLSFKHIRPNVWFRSTKSGKARDFNWHNTIGFWTSLVLIVLTLTATVISYQWAGNLLYTLTGNEVPAPQQPAQNAGQPSEQPFTVPANLNELWAAAEKRAPGAKSISLRLPVTKDAVFTIDEGKSLNAFGRSTLTVDPSSASVTKWEPYTDQNAARQIRSWFRFSHTGESFGIAGQMIGFIACVGGCFLVFTGLSLALRRFSGWRRRSTSAA
jgi:uncharacterized iron-regulated membrane protein